MERGRSFSFRLTSEVIRRQMGGIPRTMQRWVDELADKLAAPYKYQMMRRPRERGHVQGRGVCHAGQTGDADHNSAMSQDERCRHGTTLSRGSPPSHTVQRPDAISEER